MMPIRTASEFLDVQLSDDHESADDLEALEDSRVAGLGNHRSKKRRLTESPTNNHSDADQDLHDDGSPGPTVTVAIPRQHLPVEAKDTVEQIVAEPAKKTTSKNLSSKRKPSHPGVIYLSRIPPFMRPPTVRSLLSAHGPINQLFLTPEPPSTYLARKHAHGNKKRSFIDGWVEFVHKRHAKACVDAINGKIVGGKKGGWYRDDVWNAKYLSGFKWADLMEGVRREEREREERVRVGLGRDKREREEFLRGLEGSKIEETRRRKKLKREDDEGKVDPVRLPQDERGDTDAGHKKESRHTGMRFRQNNVTSKAAKGPEQADEINRVLSKIF